MLRALAVATVILSTLPLAASAGAQEADVVDDDPTAEWTAAAIPSVLTEIALLGEVGVFESNPVVSFIIEWTGVEDFPLDEALGELEFFDQENQRLLDLLGPAETARLSEAVRRVMSPVPTGVVQRFSNGDRAFIAAGPWLDGLVDLVRRDGAAPTTRDATERQVIVELLRAIDGDGEVDLDAFADQAGTTNTGVGVASDTSVPSAAGGSGNDEGFPAIVVAAVAASLVFVAALLIRRRGSDGRRADRHPLAPADDPGLVDILDISRRMTAALDVAEVRRIAVDESIRLADAEAGAFVVPGPNGATITEASMDALFSSEPVRDGALARAMETGQSTQLVSDDDPALVKVPVALATVPVIAGGGVAGAVIVIRQAHAPFGAGEVKALELLAPVTGSALRAAETHGSAISAADFDGLTELHNRRRLDQDLGALTDASTACFAMLDVDNFKAFNDTHGHLAGDIALQSVAKAIEANVREADTVYRYGGEEFSVLLRHCGIAEAVQVLDRVRVAVSETLVPGADGTPQTLTISVGITTGDGKVGLELPGSADEALYLAKRSGRDRIVTAGIT